MNRSAKIFLFQHLLCQYSQKEIIPWGQKKYEFEIIIYPCSGVTLMETEYGTQVEKVEGVEVVKLSAMAT